MTAPRRRWFRLTAIGVAALYLAAGGAKCNPGGPFISLSCDVVPFTLAFFVLAISVRSLRDKGLNGLLLAVIPMAVATLAMSRVATNVLEFWMRACARGDLIGL